VGLDGSAACLEGVYVVSQQNRIKVFGPPGTGKTTWCIETLGHHLEAGDRVLFVSFTRAAADEGHARLVARFGEIPAHATCRTLHSLCLRILDIPKTCLFEQWDVRNEFYHTIDRMNLSNQKIAGTLELYQRLRNQECYTPDILEHVGAQYELSEVEGLKTLFVNRYEAFKARDARVDFTDLLFRVSKGEGSIPEYDVVIIDEAQDLTTLQWRVMERICLKGPHTVYAVGDDDQSVYQFMGADVEYFLNWPCTSVQVLNRTYRLPQNFLDYSQRIAERISHRQQKTIRTEVGQNGLINVGNVTSHIPFYRHATELYVVRNRYMLSKIQQHLALFGCPYSGRYSPWMSWQVQSIGTLLAWKDGVLDKRGWTKLKPYMPNDFVAKIEHHYPIMMERGTDAVLPSLGSMFKPAFFEDTYGQWWRKFYPKMPSALRALVMKGINMYGPTLCFNPTLELTTIHGAKGKEADCVYVASSITDKISKRLMIDDTEHRVFYVGVTRAKKELFLLSDHRFKEQYPFPTI
jgi:superfamily I DNA/RNA helicase